MTHRIAATRVSPVLVVIAIAMLAAPRAARADFTETFCSSGLPAAPWTEGGAGVTPWAETNDSCGGGGWIGWDMHADPLPEGSYSSQLTAPAGEQFTGFSAAFGAETDPDGDIFIAFGDGQSTTILAEYEDSANGLSNVSLSESLPDVTTLWTRTDCDDPNGCALGNFIDVLQIGQMSVTIHDTGVPAVSATGGSLATDGTVTGTGTVLFNATDTGSGVHEVTLSLGSTVVGQYDSTCQSASLTPCPSDVSGTISADTATLPDGTYPVILTASDVSGDQTPVQVGDVTLRNHTGVLSVPAARARRGRPRPLKVRARFKWDWQGTTTRLLQADFGAPPRHATITVACVGNGCPFTTLTANRAHVAKLVKRLAGRNFAAGDKVKVTIAAPHRTAERGTLSIQSGALPTVTGPAAHRHRHAAKHKKR